MFNVVAEQVAALQKASLEQFSKATELAFAQSERAFAWNVGVAKQLSDEAITNVKNAANVRDVQDVAALVRGAESKTEQFATIGKSVYDQVTRVQSENVKFAEHAAAELNAATIKFIENVAKSVPVGGDAFAQQFKQFVAVQQNAANQANSAFKQAASVAQSQWQNAASAAEKVVVKAKGRK
jgi:hypothetical protein